MTFLSATSKPAADRQVSNYGQVSLNRNLLFYLSCTGTWFLAFGIQSVAFAWLLTIELQSTPTMVGIAQMALLLPGTLLILPGGSLADQIGGRFMAGLGHGLATLAPLLLAGLILTDQLTYGWMLVYALVLGSSQALVTPARDGLLNQVAGGRVQRAVMLASMIQFGTQMFGFLIASATDFTGPVIVLLLQASVLASGIVCFIALRIERPEQQKQTSRNPLPEMLRGIRQSAATLLRSPPMRAVLVLNCAMGVLFMASYMVTLPILVRDVYAGTATQLSWVNAANSFGLMLTIVVMLLFGDVARRGRALLLSQIVGAFALAAAGLVGSFMSAVLCIFAWGLCGGVAMTMSRTIMQEEAPAEERGRVMAFYYLAFMGSGPVGAVFCGYLTDFVGPQMALIQASGLMLLVSVTVALFSSLWRLELLHHKQDLSGQHGKSSPGPDWQKNGPESGK